MIPQEWFRRANERIQSHILRTPLTYDARHGLYLKWDNRQVTGSFKARGAFNKVLALEGWEREVGLVVASAGNHGQGVALAAKETDARAKVFVPTTAVRTKVDAIRALGGEVVFVEGGYGEAEQAARDHAVEHGRTFVSPYNDGQIIAGQGTVALEIVDQLKAAYGVDPGEVAAWIIPTGGGGLISGCASALAGISAGAAVIGVQPEQSAFTHSLLKRGTQDGVVDGATLADGLSGAIDASSITIPIMRELMEDILLVSEDSIARAIAHAWWAYGERIEGSAAVALAAALDGSVGRRPAVVVLTGGNIDPAVFEAIIARHPQEASA